jgi:ornithine carbamoyltransferase
MEVFRSSRCVIMSRERIVSIADQARTSTVAQSRVAPQTKLGAGLLAALVVGSMIGSGVFSLPQNMAAGADELTDRKDEAVPGADFVYTDVWLSMGESKELWADRIRLLRPYQVNADVMALTGKPHAKFMHCLPAFHDTSTTIGAEIAREFGIESMEVTDEAFESPASIVFEQAENRMHSIKTILVATIGA